MALKYSLNFKSADLGFGRQSSTPMLLEEDCVIVLLLVHPCSILGLKM